ncbi:MAG: hypothetical protein JRH05_14195 [Deltaproteobacteria bacterium]|nr:hypothetical protein [Deltaproteobacteria bacterium]
MSQDPIEQGPSLLNPNVVRAKIKEADLYVSRGLFDQAREIYRQLLSQYAARPNPRPEHQKPGAKCSRCDPGPPQGH